MEGCRVVPPVLDYSYVRMYLCTLLAQASGRRISRDPLVRLAAVAGAAGAGAASAATAAHLESWDLTK